MNKYKGSRKSKHSFVTWVRGHRAKSRARSRGSEGKMWLLVEKSRSQRGLPQGR